MQQYVRISDGKRVEPLWVGPPSPYWLLEAITDPDGLKKDGTPRVNPPRHAAIRIHPLDDSCSVPLHRGHYVPLVESREAHADVLRARIASLRENLAAAEEDLLDLYEPS